MVWLANFVIGVIAPKMQLRLGWGLYLFFGCFCFAASVFSFFLAPDTVGRSLEQIATVFNDRFDNEQLEIQTHVGKRCGHTAADAEVLSEEYYCLKDQIQRLENKLSQTQWRRQGLCHHKCLSVDSSI